MRGEHRADQWPRPGDGGEVMTKKHPFVSGVVVATVAQAMCGRRTAIIEHGDARGQERAVIAIGDRKCRKRSDDKPKRIQMWLFSEG